MSLASLYSQPLPRPPSHRHAKQNKKRRPHSFAGSAVNLAGVRAAHRTEADLAGLIRVGVRSRLAGVLSVARGAFRVPGFPPPRPPEKFPPVSLLYGAMRPASRVGKPCSPAPVLRSIRGAGAAL